MLQILIGWRWDKIMTLENIILKLKVGVQGIIDTTWDNINAQVVMD